MLSPKALLPELTRLIRIVANPPEPEEMADLCADWIEIIGEELDDELLRPAITAHLRESGFWPRPSDILKHGRPLMEAKRASSKAKQIAAMKPSRIFELEPDPPDMPADHVAYRWTYADYEAGLVGPEELGRIYTIRPKRLPSLPLTPAAPLRSVRR